MIKRAVRLFFIAGIGVVVVNFVDAQPKSVDAVKISQGIQLDSKWSNMLLLARNQGVSLILHPQFGECGNHIRWTDPSGFTSDACFSGRRAPGYKMPSIEVGTEKLWSRSIQSVFDWIEAVKDQRTSASQANKNGLYTLRWEFTFVDGEKVSQKESTALYLWHHSAIRARSKNNAPPSGIRVDKPASTELDPADAPDPTPTPIPPAKMLPAPTAKGFSQTLAAVVDAPQADLAFLLLNGPKKPLVTSPLSASSQSNTFSVLTPDGRTVVDRAGAKTKAVAQTVKPGELKIWKVNIKKWFDDHKLSKPGFYALTWTFQGQKSEPFNLYVPTPEEKARLDQEAADRQ